MGECTMTDGINPINEFRTFSTDAPIHEPEMDRFQRWPFAQRVAQTIASRRDNGSIVIGLYGAWGDGKTSVLNFIHKELKNHEHVVVVSFNPWLFGTETQMIQNFFKILADALGKTLASNKEKIGDLLEKYGSVFAAPFSMGEGVKDFGKSLNAADVNDYRIRIEKLLQEQGRRVVIFMDDIDRLDKSEIQAVFKLVKLTGDFAHTTYVLAFDEEMVAAALSEKYGSGGIVAGRHFLEKIVQVPLHLPLADRKTLRTYCFEGVDEALGLAGIELNTAQSETFAHLFVEGIQNRLHTPRMAKRYGNALTFALPILKDEVNPVDLMLLEGIRIFYPYLYEYIRENPELYLGDHSDWLNSGIEDHERLELLQHGFESLSKADRKCAEKLIQSLFPSTKAIFNNVSYWNGKYESKGSMGKRLSSLQYFQRYFLYAVPDKDVSDAMVSSFLAELESLEVEGAVRRLQELIERHQANLFIEKMRQVEEEQSPQISEVLAKALSRSGHLFPSEGEIFSFLNPYDQSAVLISKLLSNVPPGIARLELAKNVLLEGQPIDYANVCLRWMQSDPESVGAQADIFTHEEEMELGKVLVARIKQLSERSVIFLTEDHSISLLYTWAVWGSRDETNQYLKCKFEQDDTHVLHFLRRSLNQTRTLGSNTVRLSDFRRDNYNALQSIVDVEVIIEALKKVYSDLLDDPVYQRFNKEPTDQLIAMQFAFVHQQAIRG